jgi:hypothetical protein
VPDSWSAAEGATAEGLEIAKAYKAAADSTTKFAKITQNEAAFKVADPWLRPAPNGALKSSSWAALGSASQATGETAIAAPAFQAAVGYRPLDEGRGKLLGGTARQSPTRRSQR